MRFNSLWAFSLLATMFLVLLPADTQADYDTAFELYKAKKYTQAIPMLEEWCNKYPKDPRGGYTLSRCYRKTKQNTKALERLAIVLQHHPDHAPSQFLSGVLKLKSSPENALKHFEQAVKYKPDNGSYQYYYGSTLMATKQYGKAVDAMQKAVAINPKNGKAQLDLGKLLLMTNKAADSVSHLEIASKGKKTKSSALYFLGLAQYKIKDFTKAISALEKAAKVSPDDAKIFYNLGLSREALLGKDATSVEACQPVIDDFKKAVQLNSGNSDYQFRLGNAYETAARSIYCKTPGNKAVSDQAIKLLENATTAYNSAIAANSSSPATERLSGVSQMIENIKNPQIIEEEVAE